MVTRGFRKEFLEVNAAFPDALEVDPVSAEEFGLHVVDLQRHVRDFAAVCADRLGDVNLLDVFRLMVQEDVARAFDRQMLSASLTATSDPEGDQ